MTHTSRKSLQSNDLRCDRPAPDKCGGKPCIAGTRIRVHDIYVWHILDGQSAVEILAEKPELSLASISFVYDHLQQIERELADENTNYEALKGKATSQSHQVVAVAHGYGTAPPS